MSTYRDDLHTGHKVPLVETDDLMNKSVTTEKLADEAVTTEKIADGAVTNNKIAPGTIDADRIAHDAITSDKIADGAVMTQDIQDYAVTADKLSSDSVTSEKIADGAVMTQDIQDYAVTNQKLADKAVDDRTLNDTVHSKMELLVSSLYNSQDGRTLEIDGTTPLEVNLRGSARITTFGDYADVTIPQEEMQAHTIMISRAGDILLHISDVSTTFTLPNVVGAYECTFNCQYNNITRGASSTTNVNLRKYFGFAAVQPKEPTTLGTSHFSNTVGCTITIPANPAGERFKRIYFAVPSGMTISRVVQPDALNAPLAVTQVGTINRSIPGFTYTYKLYQSELLDSTVSKRLTIS
jgi:hypothetical protein